MVHAALSRFVGRIPKSTIILGRTVTMTVWSSAAMKTPTQTGIRGTYGRILLPIKFIYPQCN